MLFALVALHGVVGLAVLLSAGRLGRWSMLLAGLAPFATILWVATRAAAVLDGETITQSVGWAPKLGLTVDLRLDGFALLMVLLVSGLGSLVFAFGSQYFAPTARTARAAGLLALFAGSMFGLVLADNLLLLYVFWELTSITSYLLIGLDDHDPEARSAALHALLVTSLGGLAMLAGLVLLGQSSGTYRLGGLLADAPGGTTVSVALVLVLVGAFTKSAQYPFHSWLPGAMVAPTPISAYLHSAAMVKAGVYLVARLAPAFADVGIWRPLVVAVGLTTMVAGGLRALRPFDLKQVLAFGTVSQLGFMTVLVGIGRPTATAAGCALLLAHGVFKAALFMVVGIVDHEAHTRDVRLMPYLGSGWGLLRATVVVSAASMAAIPPLAGFIAKEEAYASLVDGTLGDRITLAGIVAGSVLTAAYSLRFAAAFVRPDSIAGSVRARATLDQGPSSALVAPAVVLACVSVALGLHPTAWSHVVDQAAHALDVRAGAHLALWHGFSAPLLLSLLTVGAGFVLFGQRRRVAVVQARVAPAVSGRDAYEGIVRSTLRVAGRVTSTLQSGSLPAYTVTILTTAAIATSVALLGGRWWPGWPEVIGRTAHVPIAALIVVGALAATMASRRFAAALLLGVVGYGMAILFVVQGAPDLALTQFAVETLSVLVFLLVLRRLPDRFERRTPAVIRSVRLAISVAVGAFVVLMAITSAGWRTQEPVSDAMSQRALPDGDGRNVVNVILVDIRGMDTVGEVTVLVAAGIGIVALARGGEQPRRKGRQAEHEQERTVR